MSGAAVPRSALFVPATASNRHARAFEAGADAVILDLEDAVAPARKDEARRLLDGALTMPRKGCEVIVRVNSPLEEAGARDLCALASLTPDRVMVPKASIKAVDRAAKHVDAPLVALVETAHGILHAAEIAAHPAVSVLMLGPIDLRAELGCTEGGLLAHCRAQLALASAAAELPGPLDGPCVHVRDVATLAREIADARGLGFSGKACIHPIQVEPVNAGFSPAEEEVAWADRVVASYEPANSSGVLSVDGEMIDLPVLKRAQQILERQTAQGATS